MKRIYQSVLPGEGAAYRNLTCTEQSSSSSGGEYIGCFDCLGAPVVPVIGGPGCADFPEQDNNIGALPTLFASDVEIDTYGFDPDFSSLSSESPSTGFTDMWDMLSVPHKAGILIEDCYCPGQGLTRPGLTLGRSRFPRIPTLPFFWIPAAGAGGAISALTAREYNPVESLAADCCDIQPEHIKVEIIENQIQLTPYLRPELDHIYRAKDTHTTFQLRAGYPRLCCLKTDCEESESLSEPGHVLRWLHFPRWPTADTHDPYAASEEPKEPLGIIPRVVDIQCDYNTGLLHIFYANDVIHDGHFADLQWDVLPPRPGASDGEEDFDPAMPPMNPELLPVNEDYQGGPVYDPGEFDNPIGTLCEATCDLAAANMGIPEEGCEYVCMTDGAVCPDGEHGIESIGIGLTENGAIISAYVQSAADTAAAGCTPSVTSLCYAYQVTPGNWEAAVKACCAAP